MPKGFDAFASMLHGVAAKFAADGYKWSAGYIFTHSKFKTLRDRAECVAVSAAGMYNVLVFENGTEKPNLALAGIDAPHITALTIATGAPRDRSACVYRAVDFDAAASLFPSIEDYFRHLKPVVNNAGFDLGVYGSGAVCKMLKDAGLVDKTWLSCSAGWSGYALWKPHADIVQGLPQTVHGVDIDPDQSTGAAGGFKVAP